MKKYEGEIAEEWTPTYENVTREFIVNSLYKIMFSEKIPNFKFEFREKEAIDFIEQTLNDYSKNHDIKFEAKKTINELKKIGNFKTGKPAIIVKNYKNFFEYLRQIYEKDIELYFQTSTFSFPKYEKDNCFEQIWLRMTPEDFNNSEEFLKKQAQMVNDTTFDKYNNTTYLGEIESFAICVKNRTARTWDENFKEIEIIVYDKKQYENRGKEENNKEKQEIPFYDEEDDIFSLFSDNTVREKTEEEKLATLQHYILPLIRYGIYEKDGKKICSIGSVQNKNDNHKPNEIDKRVNRVKYKANQDIKTEDTEKVEPKNLLALSMFINMLNKEGINEIEVPGFYVLDYEFHKKLSKELTDQLKKEWPNEKIEMNPEEYEMHKQSIDSLCNKEDLISEIKTERLLLTFRRLLLHYPKGRISSYPGELDSFMHLNIPKIKGESDINGSIFKKIYKMQEQIDMER